MTVSALQLNRSIFVTLYFVSCMNSFAAPLKEADDQSEWFEQDSYTRMWTKTQLIFHLIATSALLDDYDYFLLGGDDLYVLVDNLRAFLASERIQALSGKFVDGCIVIGVTRTPAPVGGVI